VKLTVVGCAGSYPSAASPASCYLVEHDGVRVLLDLGNGALGALQQHVDLIWPDALAAVVLSHCHVDHCVDLASLYVQRHYSPSPPVDRLRVVGPSDARARIASVYGVNDPRTLDTQFAFEVLSPDPVTVGPFTITSVRAAHPVESYSLRIEAGGVSITYSGDTGPSEGLVELAQGTDVALFEASFVGDGNPRDLHLSGADAAAMAARAGAGLLVLTHLVAWNDERRVLDEASPLFPGPVEIARAGMTITV
jgi:ribonuclease BN (tRNA processing enzyme)